jgi:glycosyltransferase involved in cell wall biosynthesis
MLDLTVAMLVRNPPIDRLAALVQYTSEIASEFIIVDTGSTPEELEVMASWNKHPFGLPKVQIVRRPWKDDFAWARNEALPYVTRKWILALDPDELPSYKMMTFVKGVVENDPGPKTAGYLIYTPDYYNGVRVPYQEFQWHVRLFRKGEGVWYRALDELVTLRGLGEHETRGTDILPKAPEECYLIHSKGGPYIEQSRRLYERLRAEGKDRL